MKESKVVDLVKKLFKKTFNKCYITKIHVSPIHNKGFPDLVIVTDLGTFFLEVKAPKKKPTKLQLAVLKKLSDNSNSNTFVYWVSYDTEKKGLLFYEPENGNLECLIEV